MKYGASRTSRSSFHDVTDSVNFPKFVSDLLKSVFDAILDIQHMDSAGTRLVAVGFVPLGQVTGPFQAGDVAVSASRIAIYNGNAWSNGNAMGLWPPYKVYRFPRR